MADLETFRAETRAWLEANCPPSMRTPMPAEEAVNGGKNATFANPDSKLWFERMRDRGWTAPTWPNGGHAAGDRPPRLDGSSVRGQRHESGRGSQPL